MPTSEPDWLRVVLSYPCATCGAPVDRMCVTSSGNRADIPHAARTNAIRHCRKCGTRLSAGSLDDYCAHCLLVRSLLVERYSPSPRHEP